METYTIIEPIHTPATTQPYLAVALIQPKYGSKILAASAYMPQLNTLQGRQTYRDLLDWLTKLFNENYPNLPILMGGDLRVTPHPDHNSHYLPLEEFCRTTSLAHIRKLHTSTYTPANPP
jgi:hypothetical protein